MNALKNFRYWLLAAVVFAAVAAVGSVQAVRSFAGAVQAVAVKRDVQAGEILTQNDLTLVEQARGTLYGDAVLSPRDAVGMAVRGFLPAGTVLRRSMLVPPQQAGMAGAVASLGPGYVAVAVPNTLGTTVAGTLESGNRVDVYSRASDKEPPVKVASDVLVLRAGAVRTREGEQPTQGVVLAVPEADLPKLLPYVTGGKEASLTFVLKPLASGQGAGQQPQPQAQQQAQQQPQAPPQPQPQQQQTQQPQAPAGQIKQ